MRLLSRLTLCLAASWLPSIAVARDGNLSSCPVLEKATPGPKQIPGHCPSDAALRLNDLQLLGTHNSTHISPSEAELAAIAAGGEDPRSYTYTYPSITRQLEMGVRNFEFDVHLDRSGTLPDTAQLGSPFRVFHGRQDWRVTCQTLTSCLSELKSWSDGHRDHVPILFYIQLKPPGWEPPSVTRDPTFKPTDPYSIADVLEVERIVLDVFGTRLIRPDEVRRDFASLRDAALANAWPTLSASRGRVLAVLHTDYGSASTPGPDPVAAYRALAPSLKDRAMFIITDDATAPDAAIVNVREPEPVGSHRIRALVQQGHMVRRRTDANLVEARTADTSRRDAAMQAGAQLLATNVIVPFAGTGYVVELGAPARCSPSRNVCNANRY